MVHSNYPSQNAELLSNVQTINALTGQGSYQIFDYFFVTGQAQEYTRCIWF